STLVRRDVAAVLMLVDHLAAWGFAQDVTRFLGTDWLLKLDIDRFRMADEDRNTHRRAGDLDLRIKHLLGFGHYLPLFLGVAVFHEDVDVRNDVEGDALGELLVRDRICHEDGTRL